MALNNDFISGVGIALVATTLALSPRARRMVRKGTTSALAGAIKVGKVAARGTRNLQEESKHVVRMGVEAPNEGPDDTTKPPSSQSPST